LRLEETDVETSVDAPTRDGLSGPATGAPSWSQFPSRLRLLCVGPQEPSWTSLTLQLDAEGCLEPQFRFVSESHDALTLLRDESFDCVLICDTAGSRTDTAGSDTTPSDRKTPLALVRAIRASGCDDPVVFISAHVSDGQWAELCRHECEVLVSPNLWDSTALVPVIKRAISRIEILRENRQLALANHRRLLRERDEAEHLLRQQRQIVRELEFLARSARGLAEPSDGLDDPISLVPPSDGGAEHTSPNSSQSSPEASSDWKRPAWHPLPEQVYSYYDELLRTYVIMGAGNLGSEIAQLAQVLAVAGLSPREALELHLERVENLVRGLGNRSTRHVMARADLLALELVIHLGECYQRRSVRPDGALAAPSVPDDTEADAPEASPRSPS